MGGCRAAKVKDFFRSQKIVFCSMHHFSSFFGCYFRFFVYEHALISYFFFLSFLLFPKGPSLEKQSCLASHGGTGNVCCKHAAALRFGRPRK